MSSYEGFRLLALGALLLSPAAAQTWTTCSPLERSDCPPDLALGRSVSYNFADGASDDFIPNGNPTFNSDGAAFTIAGSGDSPQFTSKWYMMFGRIDIELKTAPGAGIVSSVVLQSDTLDEIDWEWLGADPAQVQTNYFGKGQTGSYDRGAFHPDPDAQTTFKTYSIDWTAGQIVWQINGNTVRVLTPETAAANQYPQTPMQLKFGSWSGGDPGNQPGVIEWAKGPTDYSAGPYTMYVRSVKAVDYSTGTQYVYSDRTGSWQSIKATNGQVNSEGGAAIVAPEEPAPAITSTASGPPEPFSPEVVRPTVFPWVPEAPTTLTRATNVPTTLPGLPSGWTVSNSGKVVPPSSAPLTSAPADSTGSASQPSVSASAGGSEAPIAPPNSGASLSPRLWTVVAVLVSITLAFLS